MSRKRNVVPYLPFSLHQVAFPDRFLDHWLDPGLRGSHAVLEYAVTACFDGDVERGEYFVVQLHDTIGRDHSPTASMIPNVSYSCYDMMVGATSEV